MVITTDLKKLKILRDYEQLFVNKQVRWNGHIPRKTQIIKTDPKIEYPNKT